MQIWTDKIWHLLFWPKKLTFCHFDLKTDFWPFWPQKTWLSLIFFTFSKKTDLTWPVASLPIAFNTAAKKIRSTILSHSPTWPMHCWVLKNIYQNVCYINHLLLLSKNSRDTFYILISLIIPLFSYSSFITKIRTTQIIPK